jgi:hypothetical protein
MHGGRSTGPRTAEGRARIQAARTIHGGYGAQHRAWNRNTLTMLRRGKVAHDACCCRDRLPDALRVCCNTAPELMPPPVLADSLSPAQDRAILKAEAEALAPWKAAIALARAAARRSTANARAKAHAPARAPAAAEATDRGSATIPMEIQSAAATAKAHAPAHVPATMVTAAAVDLSDASGAPAVQVSTVQACAIQAPAVQAPAVQAHAPAQAPAAGMRPAHPRCRPVETRAGFCGKMEAALNTADDSGGVSPTAGAPASGSTVALGASVLIQSAVSTAAGPAHGLCGPVRAGHPAIAECRHPMHLTIGTAAGTPPHAPAPSHGTHCPPVRRQLLASTPHSGFTMLTDRFGWDRIARIIRTLDLSPATLGPARRQW